MEAAGIEPALGVAYLQDSDFTLYNGDVMAVLRELPSESVDCVITSPPYWGLRDYSAPGQLGLEPTPEQYVERMVVVFREVRRVLATHGTCWVNMGDSYSGGGGNGNGGPSSGLFSNPAADVASKNVVKPRVRNLKPKDLCGIPWRLAFALQADGWYLRSDIVWSKPNPMPESVTDRPTKAHEYVFLLTKGPRYFFDQEAVREPAHVTTAWPAMGAASHAARRQVINGGDVGLMEVNPAGRNIRSVWEIATQPYPEAHFATFPEELVRRCLLAGCPEQVCGECGKARERVVELSYTKEGAHAALVDKPTDRSAGAPMPNRTDGNVAMPGPQAMKHGRANKIVETLGFTDCGHDAYRPGIVLDPFIGSGTTALVARKHGRRCVGIELNAEYCALAAHRTQQQSLYTELV